MEHAMAGDQTAGLIQIARVVGQGAAVGMAEGAAGGTQHRLGGGHIPVLWSRAPRKRHIEISLTPQDRGHLPPHAAHGPAGGRSDRLQQALQPGIPVVAAGHQHHLLAAVACTQLRRSAHAQAILPPGSCRLPRLPEQPEPELLDLRQQHHPQHRTSLPHQSQMHGVLASALQKIPGAIERIQDPKPIGRQRHPGRQLLLGGLLAQQGPGGFGECRGKPLEQPLVDRQIGGRNRTLAPFLDSQDRREIEGWLKAPAISPQDVGSTPGQPPEFAQQGLQEDPRRQAGGR